MNVEGGHLVYYPNDAVVRSWSRSHKTKPTVYCTQCLQCVEVEHCPKHYNDPKKSSNVASESFENQFCSDTRLRLSILATMHIVLLRAMHSMIIE